MPINSNSGTELTQLVYMEERRLHRETNTTNTDVNKAYITSSWLACVYQITITFRYKIAEILKLLKPWETLVSL